MIKDGKHDEALHSLRALWKATPGSSYIPFLLGNLYYDQLWWGVAMDCYASAIARNGAYRNNATLVHNVIRMLGSSKTSGTASTFLRKTIGKPAINYLKTAAAHDDNPAVRKLFRVSRRTISDRARSICATPPASLRAPGEAGTCYE